MDDTRRDFIAGAAALPLASSLAAQNTPAGIPTRPLGKTGVQVSILGLGGHHQARPKDEKDSFHLVHAAID
ncbi:MAG: aldo/keto reductase, partial [Acidobacteriota bacterium]